MFAQIPMDTWEPTCNPKNAAALGVATNSSGRDGSARRPEVIVTRSWLEYSPSALAMSSTWASRTLLRPPVGVSVPALNESAQATPRT